jgi:hypothetical protein
MSPYARSRQVFMDTERARLPELRSRQGACTDPDQPLECAARENLRLHSFLLHAGSGQTT